MGLDHGLTVGDDKGLVGYDRDILGSFLACIIGQMMVPFCDRKCCRKDKFGGEVHEFSLKYLWDLHFILHMTSIVFKNEDLSP